jgi:hypothetical protein
MTLDLILDYVRLGFILGAGFAVGIAFHVLIILVVPLGEQLIKGLWVTAFMFPVIVVPFIILLFLPFAPYTAIAVFGGTLIMGIYAIYWVVNSVF